jgi:predicted secreted protein
MHMTLLLGIVIYALFWSVTLFITMPFRMRSQSQSGSVVEGTDPGAPDNPKIGLRLAVNTLIAGAFFAAYWFVTEYLGIGVDSIPTIIKVD